LAASLVAAMRMQAQSAPVQNPPAPQQQTPAPKESNPFPEDTTSVPVMPSRGSAPVPESSSGGSDVHLPLPSDNKDPVRSPDDAGPANDSPASDSWSSSQSGLQKILPSDNDDQPEGKRRKLSVPGPEHEETSKEDIDVGKYYLESKNWRAALSRFESALVLAPDEPDVYWGLAESDRHLGNFAEARANYQKVVDYDPDGPHGKAARKALKDPEIANAKAVPPSGPASSEPKQ
jgi:hypothetical protein